MFLPQRFTYYSPSQFIGTSAVSADSTLLGTTQKFTLPRTWPLEDLYLFCNFQVANSTALTLKASPQTPDQYDNLLQLIQHVNLTVNDGKQPRSVIDASGVALLEYQDHDAFNLDMGTRAVIALSQSGTLPTGNYTLVYRLPCVDNSIAEPLRSRLYLPIHTYPQDPVLTLQFQTGANMYTAGNIYNVQVDLMMVSRQVTAASEAALQSTAATNPNGYIDWDLIEQPFTVPLGSGSQIRVPLALPGSYTNLMMRHYFGGTNITKDVIDVGATGSSFANENSWDIESGNVVIRQWRWRHLRVFAEQNDNTVPFILNPTNVFVAATSGGSPTANVTLAKVLYGRYGVNFPASSTPGAIPGTSAWLDFLTDGQSEDIAQELGSVLDCNTPANSGLKMEIVGAPTSVATNASILSVMGRRLFGDLSRWQKFA